MLALNRRHNTSKHKVDGLWTDVFAVPLLSIGPTVFYMSPIGCLVPAGPTTTFWPFLSFLLVQHNVYLSPVGCPVPAGLVWAWWRLLSFLLVQHNIYLSPIGCPVPAGLVWYGRGGEVGRPVLVLHLHILHEECCALKQRFNR